MYIYIYFHILIIHTLYKDTYMNLLFIYVRVSVCACRQVCCCSCIIYAHLKFHSI